MNENIKSFLFSNAVAIVVAFSGLIFFICGYILSLRADVNASQFQIEAMQQSVTTLNTLIPQVAAIKQLSQDTNDKINLLYTTNAGNKN